MTFPGPPPASAPGTGPGPAVPPPVEQTPAEPAVPGHAADVPVSAQPLLEDPEPLRDALVPDPGGLRRLRELLLELLDEEWLRLETARYRGDGEAVADVLHGWIGAATYCGVPRLLARLRAWRAALHDGIPTESFPAAVAADLRALRRALAGTPPNHPPARRT